MQGKKDLTLKLYEKAFYLCKNVIESKISFEQIEKERLKVANQCCVCKGRLGFFDTAYKIAEECDDHLLCEFCYGVMQEIIEAPSVEDYQKKRSHFNRLTQDPGTPRSIIDRFDAIDIEWKRKETVSLEKERE